MVARVNDTLNDLQTSIESSFNSVSCGRRSLQASSVGNSLKSAIDDAIASANATLASLNIVLSADVNPYFDREALKVGIDVELSAKIEQSASDVIGFIGDFINNATQPESGDGDFTKMGLGSSDDTPVSIDFNELLDDTVSSSCFMLCTV